MLPVNYLFEDIYRNDFRRRSQTGPWVRDLRFLVRRKRS